jgi:hypothetical protein
MHQVEFTPLIPFDENRASVASGLRHEFQQIAGCLSPDESQDLMSPKISVFEVLIGLAGQADSQIPLTVPVWFHIFIENLGLDAYTDENTRGRSSFHVEKIIHRFNNREYRPNGRGGIFPMRSPRHDQREVELWYQMGEYMTEEGMY